eukprot:3380444-Prymnesium_polylepis.1
MEHPRPTDAVHPCPVSRAHTSHAARRSQSCTSRKTPLHASRPDHRLYGLSRINTVKSTSPHLILRRSKSQGTSPELGKSTAGLAGSSY